MKLGLSRKLIGVGLSLLMAFTLLPFIPAYAEPSFTFTATGDYGNTKNTNSTLDSIAASSPSFNLGLGDLGYLKSWKPNASIPAYYGGNGEERWCDIVKSRLGASFPFELIVGNHENSVTDLDGFIANYAACLPDRINSISYEAGYAKEYYFDYPTSNPLSRVIMIAAGMPVTGSGNYSYATGTIHNTWLSNAIDGARAAGIPWVIVGMHHVCINTGTASCQAGVDLMKLLVNKRVDLILQAHDHTYQRSKQLTCIARNTYNPSCVSDDGADNAYHKGAGSVIVIAGVPGGGALEAVNTTDTENPYFARWMGSNNPNPYCGCTPGRGFVKYAVSSTQISAQFIGTPTVMGTTTFTTAFTDSFTIDGHLSTSFVYSPVLPNNGSQVTFTATASRGTPPYSFSWDFGDGGTSTGNVTTHSFALGGIYNVQLTATDVAGQLALSSQDIAIASPLLLQPNGPGSQTSWTKNSACTANWNCVNESTPDGDSTYVRTSTAPFIGKTDLYRFVSVSSIVPEGSTVDSVKVMLIARKTNTSSATVAPFLKVSGQGVTGDPLVLTTSYTTYTQTYANSPFTGTGWTLAELDQLEVGETYITGKAPARVTNILLEIIYKKGAAPPPISSIVVTPSLGTVGITGTLQFSAIAYDSNAAINGAVFTWATTIPSATIDTTGLFKAGNISGTFPAGVSASSQGISGYADVQVFSSPPASLLLQPIGPASLTGWTKSYTSPAFCSANWNCVNEVASDGDATYVRASSAGATDVYDLSQVSSQIPQNSNILWVKISFVARKSGTSDANIAIYVKSGTSTTTGSSAPLSTSYQTYSQTYLVSPFSGTHWSVAELDALETGQTYLSGTSSARVTYMLVEVRYQPTT